MMPVLVSSFSTSSRVNDLEVYGDSLFAATNGGLYKLDASDPDELSQILFVPAICGNGIVEGDEVCDGGQIDCTELDVSGNVSTNSGFVSGTATCNSTCDGYNTNNCSDDGW